MYHKNSTYRIFKDQNNEKHERKIISLPLLYKKIKQDFLHRENMIIWSLILMHLTNNKRK